MHPLRGFAARLCLCLCVLFAQGVAAVHAFEHLHGHDASALAVSDAADAVCALCLAAGGFGAVLGGTGQPSALPASTCCPGAAIRTVPCRSAGAYLARAPPTS